MKNAQSMMHRFSACLIGELYVVTGYKTIYSSSINLVFITEFIMAKVARFLYVLQEHWLSLYSLSSFSNFNLPEMKGKGSGFWLYACFTAYAQVAMCWRPVTKCKDKDWRK